MIRLLFATSLVALLALAMLPAEVGAQFADDTQNLFDVDDVGDKVTDHQLNFEFSTAPDEDQLDAENAGAQSVEELCCAMTPEERVLDGLCVDVVCE